MIGGIVLYLAANAVLTVALRKAMHTRGIAPKCSEFTFITIGMLAGSIAFVLAVLKAVQETLSKRGTP